QEHARERSHVEIPAVGCASVSMPAGNFQRRLAQSNRGATLARWPWFVDGYEDDATERCLAGSERSVLLCGGGRARRLLRRRPRAGRAQVAPEQAGGPAGGAPRRAPAAANHPPVRGY